MTFESKQKQYYLNEMNRALPTTVMKVNDSTAMDLALGNIDPVVPTRAIALENIVSDFGYGSSAINRDAECRALPYPGGAMRAPDARTGCGWWYSADPAVHSIGAYGSIRGPMSPTLDKQIGPGEWIWEPQEAYKKESLKAAAAIKTCSDLKYKADPRLGWCSTTNRGVATDGNGRPAFPRAAGGDCPDGKIVMDPAQCERPIPGSPVGTSDICTPTNGQLGPACLQSLVGQVCSPNGTLAQTLGSSYAGNSDRFNQVNAIIADRGFTLHSGIVRDGRLSAQDALSSAAGLKSFANTGNGSRATAAALNLCYGTPFDPCKYTAGDSGPFDPTCITQTALGMGYTKEGGLLPGKIGQAYWNQFKTWQSAVDALTWWKKVADLGPAFAGQNITPQLQAAGVSHVYGLSVKYPKSGCNNFGILMYRYYFPTWNLALFPAAGPKTHFLGRYILKEGFPRQRSHTYRDQTPAGGYLTEGQRMVANFIPAVGGTYQFLISCDDYVRLQINGQVIAQVGCCGVPTPSQTINLIQGQIHTMIVDLWNGGGPWSFSIRMSVNGSRWREIPLKQLYMTQDRRLPAVELAFNKMTQGAIKDTNNVFQNLALSPNARIGTLNGRTCLVVNGPNSCVHNHASVSQGIRLRAMKSITLMVQISSVRSPTGTTPSIVSFFNLPSSNVTASPQPFASNRPYNYFDRKTDFMITANSALIYPWGINPNPHTGTSALPYPVAQWFHLAFVWDDDFAGYVMYVNGAPTPQQRVAAYDVKLIMEQIRIGCDAHPEGQHWTGGIAWFRAFDYRLSADLIKRDMNDDWASLT